MTSIAAKKTFASLSLLIFLLVTVGSCLASYDDYLANREGALEYLSKLSPHQHESNVVAGEKSAFPVKQTKYSVIKSRFRLKRSASSTQQFPQFAISNSSIASANLISYFSNSSPIQFSFPALGLLRTIVLLH